MSTKANFKRIALVASASLVMGLLSTLPAAQASVIGTPTVTAANGSLTKGKSDSTTAASLTVSFFSQNSTDSAAITLAAGSFPAGSFDSTMIHFVPSDTTAGTVETKLLARADNGIGGASANGANEFTKSGGLYVATAATGDTTVSLSTYGTLQRPIIKSTGLGTASGTFLVYLDSGASTGVTRTTAGTFTVPYTVEFYSNGALDSTKSVAGTLSFTLTIDGTAAAGSVSAAATSSSLMYAGADLGNATTNYNEYQTVDSTSVSMVNTPNSTADAIIKVVQKTAAGLASRESITVTIDKGNVGDATNGALGKSVTFVGNANGVNYINVYADGSSGLATITLKTTSVTFANKTLTWYSSTIASITVTKLGNTLGSASTGVLVAVAKDAQGNVSQADVYAVATDRTIIATTVTTGTTCSYVAAYGGNLCTLAGATDGTTTITVWNTNSAATRTVSGTASLTVSTKAAVGIKMAFDKTTYAPGEVAYLRVWAVDDAGSPVAPASFTNLLATGGVTSTAALGNSSDTTTAVSFSTAFTTSADGYASADAIKLYKVYMPYSGGDITFSATGGTTLPATGQVKVTAKVSVTDNGAAALAAVTALASQVSAFITKINAQITTLTDLVMKIQKKVKA
jgi:hypothetical protein